MSTTEEATTASKTSSANEEKESSQWNTKRNKRTRSSPGAIRETKRQTFIKDYWLNKPVDTKNSFAALEQSDTKNSEELNDVNDKNTQLSQTAATEKTSKSPPIFVSGVEDIRPLQTLLNTIAKDNYSLKIINQHQVKIQPLSSEKFLPIVEELKRKKTEFYTYQRKQEKSYKVVLRNMHPAVDINELKEEIEKLNHKVIRITNIRKAETRKPLPLFFVEILANENNKEIYQIKSLLNTVISFESPRKKREIPQCTNCQEYNHTKNYCFKSPVCVKCAKNHLTKDCSIKTKIKEVTCANCGGNHPASYKGCEVHKQIQQKLFPTLRDKAVASLEIRKESQIQNNRIRANRSYAQAASQDVYQTELPNTHTPEIVSKTETTQNNKFESMMIQLMTKMDTMLNLLTCLANKLPK